MEFGDNWIVERTETGWGEPKNLGLPLNSEKNDLYPTLSRAGDLYISFRRKDGTWTKSKNMGNPINTLYREVDPVVSPDGKYIFFRSNRRIHASHLKAALTYEGLLKILDSPGNGEGDIYWVAARIIEELKAHILER